MGGMLATGTANTLVGKYLDEEVAPKSAVGCFYFTHPYIQTTFMFLGEFMVFGFLGIKILLDKRAKDQGEVQVASPGTQQAAAVKMKTNINPLLLAIPASCDVCGTTLMYLALVMVPASVY